MRILGVVMTFALLLAIKPAYAEQYFSTGNDLLANCTPPKEASINPSLKIIAEDFTRQRCKNYIEGTMDAFFQIQGSLIETFKATPEQIPKDFAILMGLFCAPSKITIGQSTDIVLAYLKRHPENRQLPAAEIIATALVEVWPCKAE